MNAVRWLLLVATVLMLTGSTTEPVGASPGVQVADIWGGVVRVRGLEPRADVAVESLDREALRAKLGVELPTLDPARRKLLVLLGVLPPELDPTRLTLDLLGAHASHLYSRSDKRVYALAPNAGLNAADRLALAHELAHALQDQHFDLQTLLTAGDGDRRAAARALVDGDAMLTMLRWGRRFLGPEEKLSLAEPDRAPGAAELAAAPLAARAVVHFSHRDGLDFVRALDARGGLDLVNKAFDNPPVSTEQVIHPDKYLNGEVPRRAVLPVMAGPLGPGWRTLTTETLGELDLRILIEQYATPEDAVAAAAGWDGDVVELLEDEVGRSALVLATVWDGEDDAAEFYNAQERGIARRFDLGLRRTLALPSLSRWSAPIGEVQLLKTGDRVLLLVAPTGQLLDVMAAQFGQAN